MLKKIQEEQAAWAKHNFGEQIANNQFLGVVEEVGELSHALLKRTQGIRVNEDHDANVKDAVGDIIIYLANLCTCEGIDLEKTVQDTWDSVKMRDWIKYPEDGISK